MTYTLIHAICWGSILDRKASSAVSYLLFLEPLVPIKAEKSLHLHQKANNNTGLILQFLTADNFFSYRKVFFAGRNNAQQLPGP